MNKQTITKINMIIIATIFFSSTLLLNQNPVMGFTINDPEYIHDPSNTPFQDMILNGCRTNVETLETDMILDSKGLLELGLPYILNLQIAEMCMTLATNTVATGTGWSITEIKTNPEDENDVVITLKYNGVK